MKKSSHLNQERNLHRSSTVYKPKQSKTALNMWLDFNVRGQHEINFFTGGSVIIDYILAKSDSLKLKTPQWWICFLQTHSFWLHKTLIDGLEWSGLLVDYCDVFISCLDSHSDGTHSLQRIHWWASDGISPNPFPPRNKLIYIFAWGWVNFCVIYSFSSHVFQIKQSIFQKRDLCTQICWIQKCALQIRDPNMNSEIWANDLISYPCSFHSSIHFILLSIDSFVDYFY